jgi:hypothetical protein
MPLAQSLAVVSKVCISILRKFFFAKSANSNNENTFLEREQNESIADLITEGTIFAVLCDDDGHYFYLLKATSESIILHENESDEWGGSFSRGSSVIRRVYFAKKNFRTSFDRLRLTNTIIFSLHRTERQTRKYFTPIFPLLLWYLQTLLPVKNYKITIST